jgi:hypothetical protein
MAKSDYKTEINTLSPVAVRTNQKEVCAINHDPAWGTVTCKDCDAEFLIAPNRKTGARTTEAQCVKELEEILAEEHARKRPHQNLYELEG